MKLQPVSIPWMGGPRLAGLLYLPDRPINGAAVILAHGFTSGKYSMDALSSYLAARGRVCLTYDVVGHKLGSTGGRMMHMRQAAENMTAAITGLRSEFSPVSVVLAGHSMGAAAAISSAAIDLESPHTSSPLAGIACICMGVNPTSGFESTLGAAMLLQRADYVEGAPAPNLLAGLDRLLESATKLTSPALPALMIAARNDVLLPTDSVRKLSEIIGKSADLRVIDAQHIDAPDKARGVIANWLQDLDADGGETG